VFFAFTNKKTKTWHKNLRLLKQNPHLDFMEAQEQDKQTNPICEPGSKPPARSEPIMMGLVIQCTGCEFLKKTTTKTTCCGRVVLIQNRTTLENTWKNNGIRTLLF